MISQTITGIFTPLTPPYFKTQEVRAAGESWYNSSWLYRKKITIDHTKVAADQSNFPVLINLPTDSDLASHAKSNGDDILFTSSDGITKLAHEIEKYDNTSGQLVADVKVPSVSSTTDTDIYLYYGNSGASNQQNATSVWDSNFVAVQHLNEDPSTSGLLPILDSTNNKLDATSSGTLTSGSQVNGQIAGSLQFDGTDDYVVYHPSNVVWTKSGSNPMITGQFGSMWYNGANDYHAYYSDGTNVLHATSTDGISWTVDSTHNPVLAPTVGSWDSGWIEVVQVWKEGSTWYMLYRGHSASSSERKIGLATSADGLNWTKNANNPVLSASPATWEVSDGLGLDPWGIIKIGSTYYLWYNTVNSTGSGTRATGLATSTDLIHWTKDTNNPIFQGGRYCVTPFKYGSYYYLLVPHYDGAAAHMELYRDTNPTFYPNEREFLGSILEEGTGWDSGYLDTPSVLTNDINRNSFPDTNIWMYYTGYTAFSGNIWKEGLAEFPLSDLANLETIPSKELDITSAITLEAWVKINSTTATYPLIFDRSQAYGLGLHMVSSKLYPMMELKTNLSWRFTSNGTSQVSTGQWHYIVGSYDSSHNTISYYVDGQPAGTDITNGQGNIATSSSNLKLQNPPNYAFNGNVDEARISNTARTATWISTTYHNQNSPSTFYALGSEESLDHFVVTGSSSQTAGSSQTITITAKTNLGNTSYYSSDKSLTFSGANISAGGNNPTCSDKTGADVNFGTATNVTFSSGVAACTMKLYKAETVAVNVTDGTKTAAGYTLSVAVSSPLSGASIQINSNATYTASKNTTLTLSAVNASQMKFSNDNITYSSYEAYAISKSWDITNAAYGGTSSDGTKTVYIKYKDAYGNEAASVNDNIVYDSTPPSNPGNPSTTSPTNSTSQTWSWIAATDAISGVANYAWRAVDNVGTAITNGTTSATSVVTSLTQGIYSFFVKATDNAGNTGSEAAGAVTVNTQSPTGSISINSGASYTNTTGVTLTLSASDDSDSASQLQMEISNSPDFSGASYESYTTSKSWTLSSTDGTKTVYYRIKDSAGNVSSAYSATITLDTTAPDSFDLDSPGDNSYTNSERPTFRWKAASTPDATSGLSKYKLGVDNGDSGSFTIDSIPTSGTSDIQSDLYVIHFDGFNDSDNTNNYISVYTKSSSTWGSDNNDGKLKEGKRNWKVTAYDNAGNTREESRSLLIDRSSPNVEINQLNSVKITNTANTLKTTETAPIIYGKITDSLVGDKTENKISSGPKSVEVKVEKLNIFGLYDLNTLATVNLNETYWTSNGNEITDNSQNSSDKYSSFEFTPAEKLSLGSYKITLTGKDDAGNTGGSATINLDVITFDQFTTTEEKKIIKEQGTKEPELTKQEVSPTPKTTTNNAGGIARAFSGSSNFFGNFSRYFQEVAQQGNEDFGQIIKSPKLFASRIGDWLSYSVTSFGEIVLDKEPTKITDVKVAKLNKGSVIITWKTNHLATSKVNYGLTKDFGKDVQSSTKVHEHKIEVTGLEPATKYYYEVMSQNKNYVYDANHEFTTPKN